MAKRVWAKIFFPPAEHSINVFLSKHEFVQAVPLGNNSIIIFYRGEE